MGDYFSRIKKVGISLIVALGFSLAYSPNAASDYKLKKDDGTEVIGYNNIINHELGNSLVEKFGPTALYLDNKCYMPAAGIEKLLEEDPSKVYAALDLVESPPENLLAEYQKKAVIPEKDLIERDIDQKYELLDPNEKQKLTDFLKNKFETLGAHHWDNGSSLDATSIVRGFFASLDGGKPLTIKDLSYSACNQENSLSVGYQRYDAREALRKAEKAREVLREAGKSARKGEKR